MRFYLAPKNRVLPLVSVAAIVVLALIGLGSPSAQSRIIDSASPADRDWCAEATSLAFPKTPASGKLRGQAFTVETAAILGKKLMLRQGKDFFANHEIEIYFRTEDLEGKSFSVSPTDDMFHSFNIISSLCSPGQTAPSMDTINKGYGLRIQFGKRQGNLLPGWIVLRLPDPEHSYVQGYFYASPDYIPPGTTKRIGKNSWIKDSTAPPLKPH